MQIYAAVLEARAPTVGPHGRHAQALRREGNVGDLTHAYNKARRQSPELLESSARRALRASIDTHADKRRHDGIRNRATGHRHVWT